MINTSTDLMPARLAAEIRVMIDDGQLEPGTMLRSPGEVAHWWRTTDEAVRGAFRELERQHYIQVCPVCHNYVVLPFEVD